MRHLSGQHGSGARMRGIALAFLAFLLLGCAALPRDVCREGGTSMVADTLYFGTERMDGRVTEVEWQRFVENVVTPRFPEGFTTWEARGQWREPDGRILKENTYVLQILHPNTPGQDEAIDAIVLNYKEAFQQKAVLQVRTKACVSF